MLIPNSYFSGLKVYQVSIDRTKRETSRRARNFIADTIHGPLETQEQEMPSRRFTHCFFTDGIKSTAEWRTSLSQPVKFAVLREGIGRCHKILDRSHAPTNPNRAGADPSGAETPWDGPVTLSQCPLSILSTFGLVCPVFACYISYKSEDSIMSDLPTQTMTVEGRRQLLGGEVLKRGIIPWTR